MDQAIDRTVREMVTVDPPSDITGRVLSRVKPAERPRTSWIVVGAATAVATAAVILAIVLLPGSQKQSSAPQTPGLAEQTPASRIVPRTVNAPRTITRESKGVQRPRPARVVAATIGDEELPHVDLSPLQPLEPIALAPIEHQPFAPVPLAIKPLTPIAELRVEPLTIVDDPIKGDL